MRAAVIALVLLGCGGEPQPARPRPVPAREPAPLVLGFPKLRVGETTLIERRNVARQTEDGNQTSIETNLEARSTLLAVGADGLPTKARVAYERFVTKINGTDKPMTPDLSGLTFVVERIDQGLTVIKEQSEISAEERYHVLFHLASFGVRTPIDTTLATTSWIVGKPVPLDLEYFKLAQGGTALATLSSSTDRTARFEIVAGIKKPDLKAEIRWVIEIDRLDGRITTSDMRTTMTEGPKSATLDFHLAERLAP